MHERLSLDTLVTLTARRAALKADQANTVDVLLRVQAPPGPSRQEVARPPQALALVIDRSGSMSGRPLDEAKRCAGLVVSRLRAIDWAALVEFDERVHRLCSAAPVTNAEMLQAAIDSIEAGGSTDLHGGWQEGAVALSDVPGSGIKRVILLSDGQANHGLTDVQAIADRCAEWARRGITTSTYGLGDRFNEELMLAMARTGQGNHYYGDTADDLMEPFQQELDLLGNLCLCAPELSLSLPEGIEGTVLNDLPRTSTGWRLPDLAWGSQAWAVIRLSVPAGHVKSLGDLQHLLRVGVQGHAPDGHPVSLERSGLALPVVSPATWDGMADDELVSRRLVELAAADALSAMRAAAAANDWKRVDRLLQEATERFAGHDWVASVLEAMKRLAAGREREKLRKEALYSSSRMAYRLAASDEVAMFSVADERAVPSYLRRKPAQGKGDTGPSQA